MNTNTYVAGSNDKDIVLERDQQLAKLLEDDEVLCAHVYCTETTYLRNTG